MSVFSALEMTNAKKRVWPGVISEFPYVLGLVILAAVAYDLRDWFKIQLYTSLPGVIFVFYWWYMIYYKTFCTIFVQYGIRTVF